MKLTSIRTGLLSILVSALIQLHAQNASDQVGKLKLKHFPQGACPIDPGANAYYIFDHGGSTIESINGSWAIIYSRHARIKITNKKALSESNQTIWLQNKGAEGKEELLEIYGYTYNVEDQKLIISKLTPSGYTTESGNRWTKISVKMPNVTVGSVIELYYKTQSNLFFDLPGWTFQRNLPVIETSFLSIIPEDFKYKYKVNGTFPVHSDVSKGYDNLVYYFSASSVPAFSKELFVYKPEEHTPAVEFNLISFNDGEKVSNYNSTWTTAIERLLKDTILGIQLKHCDCFDSVATIIKSKNVSTGEKIMAAMREIQNNITWDGSHSFHAGIDLLKVWQYRAGNSAEINLSLICLLNRMDINAVPVLISTREHGEIDLDRVSLDQFDHLIVLTHNDDKPQFLDGTDTLVSHGMLPLKDINGKGLIIDAAYRGWINIPNSTIGQSQISYKLTIDPVKGVYGTYSEKDFGYTAYSTRTAIADAGSEKTYLEDLNYQNPAISLFNAHLTNMDAADKELEIEGDVVLINQLEKRKDTASLVPMQMERFKQNPLKPLKRIAPVQFDYPWIQNVQMEIKFPSNYTVLNLPKSGKFQSGDKTALFTFITEQIGNSIRISSLINIKKTTYTTDEYEGIRELFEQIVRKQSEKIEFTISK